MKGSLKKEKPEDTLKLLKKIINLISRPENVQLVAQKDLIGVIYRLFSDLADVDVFSLVEYTLKLCKKYEEDNSKTLIKINWILDLLMQFGGSKLQAKTDQNENKDYINSILYNLLQLVLWLYEQETISKADINILSEKAIKLF